MVRRCAVLVLVSTLGLLAACTSSSEHKSGPTGTTSSSHKPTSSAPPLVQNSLPPASSIENNVKHRKFVEITACQSTPGGWKAVGTARNTGKKPVSYQITVFFTTIHATVMDFARTKVTVQPGATKSWQAAKAFSPQPNTRCVLEGVS